MATTPEDDPDIAELKRADAAQRRKRMMYVGAAIALPVLYWAYGFVAVRSALEQDGFTDVKVSASSPFEFKFDAKKGASMCKGTFTRLPFSSSRNSFCYSVGEGGATGSSETSH